jgi:hypothetical protein
MNDLYNGRVKTKIANPKVYIDYFKRFDYDVVEIECVNDNGYGYEHQIRFYDKDKKYNVKSFDPIDVIEWLGERYRNEAI